jgi:hypothetical protein
LEKKINPWLESHGKRARGQVGFRGYHSIMDHPVTFRITAEECRNDKIDLLCCFIDFRKAFDTVLKTNLWNRLEELKVPQTLMSWNRLEEQILTSYTVKLGVGQLPKHHGMRESVSFVTLSRQKMQNTSSCIALLILILDPNLKIFDTLQTFLTSHVIKTMVTLEHLIVSIKLVKTPPSCIHIVYFVS